MNIVYLLKIIIGYGPIIYGHQPSKICYILWTTFMSLANLDPRTKNYVLFNKYIL